MAVIDAGYVMEVSVYEEGSAITELVSLCIFHFFILAAMKAFEIKGRVSREGNVHGVHEHIEAHKDCETDECDLDPLNCHERDGTFDNRRRVFLAFGGLL